MTSFDLRMLALNKRDTAMTNRWLARSYLREGSKTQHRSHMRRALKNWKAFSRIWKEATE